MSTYINQKEIRLAEKAFRSINKRLSRKLKRRKSVQIRIGEEIHGKLKNLSFSHKIPMSFLLDKICERYFSNSL